MRAAMNGHLDTIPNQNNQPVYRDGDLLYGRGRSDCEALDFSRTSTVHTQNQDYLFWAYR